MLWLSRNLTHLLNVTSLVVSSEFESRYRDHFSRDRDTRVGKIQERRQPARGSQTPMAYTQSVTDLHATGTFPGALVATRLRNPQAEVRTGMLATGQLSMHVFGEVTDDPITAFENRLFGVGDRERECLTQQRLQRSIEVGP